MNLLSGTGGHQYRLNPNGSHTWFGPDGKGGGINLPAAPNYATSAMMGGGMSANGQNPYFQNQQPQLSLGGSPSQPAPAPNVPGVPQQPNPVTPNQPNPQQPTPNVPAPNQPVPNAATHQPGTPQTGLIGAEDAMQRGLIGSRMNINGGLENAQNLLNPTYQEGMGANQKQAALSGALGAEAQQQAINNFNESPEQAYLREQSERAITRNAAATGGLQGGNVLKELQRNAVGLASQDYQNAFDRLGVVGNRGTQAGNTMAGMDMAAGMAKGDMSFNHGQNLAAGRTRAGELLSGNIGNITSQLSQLINQGGIDSANAIGQGGNNIANLLAGAGTMDANMLQQLATLLSNVSSGAGSSAAGGMGSMPQSQNGNPLGNLGGLLGGAGTLIDAF